MYVCMFPLFLFLYVFGRVSFFVLFCSGVKTDSKKDVALQG